MSIRFLETAKTKVQHGESPVKIIQPNGLKIECFVYAEAKKIKEDSDYLEKFIEMAVSMGNVSELVLYYK